MNLAPICLFVYNRLEETKKTIEALQKNHLAKESKLYIFSDGAKNKEGMERVNKVREFLKTVEGFKKIEVFESEINKGLADSIISGVDYVIQKHGKVIVLEDDLITSANFLDFMNRALEFYKSIPEIQSINGYSLYLKSHMESVYFQTRPFSWGWATWKEYWDEKLFDKSNISRLMYENSCLKHELKKQCGDDFYKMLHDSVNGLNDSWYVRWAFSHYRNKTISVYPRESYVENIGFSDEGTHCKEINTYFSKLVTNDFKLKFIEYKDTNEKKDKEFLNYFSIKHKIYIRMKLLFSISGRRLLRKEFVRKLIK